MTPPTLVALFEVFTAAGLRFPTGTTPAKVSAVWLAFLEDFDDGDVIAAGTHLAMRAWSATAAVSTASMRRPVS